MQRGKDLGRLAVVVVSLSGLYNIVYIWYLLFCQRQYYIVMLSILPNVIAIVIVAFAVVVVLLMIC